MCVSLRRVYDALLLVWYHDSAKSFRSGYKEVDRVITDEQFWRWNCAVDVICTFVDHMRAWGGACSCHEDLCMAFAKKSQVYSCPQKGRRGPQLRRKMESVMSLLKEERQNISLKDCDGDESLMAAMHMAFDRLAGHIKLKWSFVYELPWMLWEARAPEGARRCLDAYDRDMADERRVARVHRVAHHFCSKDMHGGSSSLRHFMEERACGKPLADVLDRELMAYEMISLDECPAEGEHRHASMVRTHGAANQLASMASEMRRVQNLEAFDQAAARGDTETFLQGYLKCKSIFQASKNKFQRLIRKRMETGVFYMRVYRFGRFSMADFSTWKGLTSRGPRARNLAIAASTIEHFKLDFFERVLEETFVFAIADQLDLPGVADASVPGSRIKLFRVLDMRPGRKKTINDFNACHMLMPIVVQSYEVWGGLAAQGEVGEIVTVLAMGDPELKDAAAIGDLKGCMQRLYRYDTERASEVGGCLELSGLRLAVRRTWAPLPLGAPIYVNLHKLKAVGWGVSQSTVASHSEGDTKLLDTRDLHKHPLYLECLLAWDSLRRGGMTELFTMQLNSYYRAMLASGGSHKVLPGRPALEYQSFLQGVCQPPDHGDIIGDLVPIGGDDGECLLDVPPFDTHQCAAEAFPYLDTLIESSSAVCDLGDGLAGAAPHIVALDPTSVAAPLPDMQDPCDDDDECVVQTSLRFKRRAEDLPAQVEGMTVLEEIHNEGDVNAYHRLVIECPLAKCLHMGSGRCAKRRNIAASTTEHFGRLEVIGYLGAWASRASDFSSKEEHIRFRPSVAQVRSYLVDHGYSV